VVHMAAEHRFAHEKRRMIDQNNIEEVVRADRPWVAAGGGSW